MRLWKDRHLHLSITRLGIQYLLALVAVGAFAVNTGNNLLYLVFGLMLGLFLVSGWVSRRALRDIRPLRIEEGNLFARVRGGIRVRLTDRAPRRMRALEVRLFLDDAQVEPGFLPGGVSEAEPLVVLHAKAEHRGPTRLTGLELRTRYPFGFLEKAWRFDLDQEVLVLPHPRSAALADAHTVGTPRKVLPAPGESSPEGARPFRTGDAPSRIHWKRTAQRRLPWVRTFEAEQPVGVHLRLDLRRYAPGRAFERTLETLAGAVLQARLQKLDATLELQGSTAFRRVQGHPACWRALAVAQAEGDGGTDPETTLSGVGTVAAPVFFV